MVLGKESIIRLWLQVRYVVQFCDVNLYQNIMTVSVKDYNMTVWIWAGNYISFTIAAGLIRLHMPGVTRASACHHTLNGNH